MSNHKEIKVAFVGNPNSGKTTVFNMLTGSNQHIANWPGVTIDYKESITTVDDIVYTVVDLPGLYSLSSYSYEERISRDYILENNVDVIVNILDSSVLERNLYLTTQLMELQIPMVLVFNMVDIVKSKDISINYPYIADLLGAEYITCIGNKGENLDEILPACKKALKKGVLPKEINYFGDIESEIYDIKTFAKPKEESVINGSVFAGLNDYKIPLRYLIIKAIEGNDEDTLNAKKALEHGQTVSDKIDHSRSNLEAIYGQDIREVITECRYGFVEGIIKEAITYSEKSDKMTFTDKLDNLFLNRFLGIPLFIAIMYGMFTLTFAAGDLFTAWIEMGFEALTSALDGAIANSLLKSLMIDGIVGGVGGVVVFIPVIAFMFIMISLLEDSGYLSRAAFLSDRAMHSMGLHGKSFIPLLLGFGCNVPALMAARTLDSKADRIVTCLINPLMSCAARLPIYVLFASVFFEAKYRTLVIFSIYAIGII